MGIESSTIQLDLFEKKCLSNSPCYCSPSPSRPVSSSPIPPNLRNRANLPSPRRSLRNLRRNPANRPSRPKSRRNRPNLQRSPANRPSRPKSRRNRRNHQRNPPNRPNPTSAPTRRTPSSEDENTTDLLCFFFVLVFGFVFKEAPAMEVK